MPPSPLATNEALLLSEDLEKAIAEDDGLAAQQHLAAGRSIYFGDPDYPDRLVKKLPDGRKQRVSVSADGKITVLRNL